MKCPTCGNEKKEFAVFNSEEKILACDHCDQCEHMMDYPEAKEFLDFERRLLTEDEIHMMADWVAKDITKPNEKFNLISDYDEAYKSEKVLLRETGIVYDFKSVNIRFVLWSAISIITHTNLMGFNKIDLPRFLYKIDKDSKIEEIPDGINSFCI